MSHEATTAFFDRWATNGRDAGMEDEHGDVVRQAIEAMAIRPGQRILDLGCGNGWATRLLAQAAPGASAVGVDASREMIQRADALHSLTIRARYECAPFEKLPLRDASFDRVFSMEALYYAADLDLALAEALRVLKPGGSLDAIVDFYKESPATEAWKGACCGVPMTWLSEAEWRARAERAGFTGVALARLHDRRGAGSSESFRPDECEKDFELHRAAKACGSLWIRGVRPA
jgi:SAM-dependent methyltransferase